MQVAAVGVKEGHDLDGRDLCVEGLGVFEIVVPDLINNITKKFCNATFGRFVTGVVIEAGFVGRLCTNSDDCRGVVSDVFIVEGEAGRTYEFGVAMFCFVLGGLRVCVCTCPPVSRGSVSITRYQSLNLTPR
jgi:hypothetical protein